MRRSLFVALSICLIATGSSGCVQSGITVQTALPAIKTPTPPPGLSFSPAIVPTTVSTISPAPTIPPTATPEPPLPKLDPTMQKALDYFMEVALKSEYHGADSKGIVKRWEQPIYIQVMGKTTKQDRACIDKFLKALGNIQGLPPVCMVEKDGNNKLYFVTLDKLDDVCPGYVKGNWAYTSINWTDYKIDSAISGIAYDKTNQKQRNHLIIERIADSLGLLNDCNRYPDSIFYDKWTETQKLAERDWLVIRMLYSPVIKAGMDEEQAKKELANWLASPEIKK